MNAEHTLKSKYFIPANELLAEGNVEAAIALAQAAIQEYSNNANAYRLQGIINDRAGNPEAAISGYWKAIELEPQSLVSVYLSLGKVLTEREQWTEVLQVYQQAATVYPDTAEVHRRLGLIEHKHGNKEAALVSYQKSLELDPEQTTKIQFSIGQLYREQEQPEAAIAVYQNFLDRCPDEPQIYRLLAAAYDEAGDRENANLYYRRSIELEPDCGIWVYLNLGQLLIHQENWDEAIDLYQSALRVYPNHLDVCRSLAIAQRQQGNTEAAIAGYRQTIELDPQQDAWVYMTLGQILREEERWHEAAIVYQQAIEHHSCYAEGFRMLADTQSQLGDKKGATDYYYRAIELQPEVPAWVYLALGQLLAEQERWGEAIALYQKAIERFPDHANIRQAFSTAQMRSGNIEAAIAEYQATITLDPQQPAWVYLSLGQLLVEQSRLVEAIAVYQQAIALDSDRVEAYRLLAVAQDRAGQIEAAIATYRQAIALDGSSAPWIYSMLGQLFAGQERFDEAIEVYQQAIAVHPDRAETYRLLGTVYNSQGNFEAEIASYRQYIELQPDQSYWVYSMLGHRLSEQDCLDEAIACYQKALELYPEQTHSYFVRQAQTQLDRGDLQQAILAFQQALFLSSECLNDDAQLDAAPSAGQLTATVRRVCIITPVFNGEEFIDDTIYSVVTQSGDFIIRYHVQDGQSTDGTIEKLKAWEQRLNGGDFPILCQGIEFTFASTPDRGMYDAIMQGAAAIDLQDSDFMTWINADDRLAAGSLATVADIFTVFDRVHWLGGRIALIDDRGVTTHLSAPHPVGRRAIRAGLHDGRHFPFIMQEGTFWRGWLWRKVEGVDTRLNLAGDFDLWRKFSQYAHYLLVDSVLATHRKRSGQLSGDMDGYYKELEGTLGDEGLALCDYTWRLFEHPDSTQLEQLRNDFSGRILQFDRGLQSWQYSRFPYARHLSPLIVVSATDKQTAIGAFFGAGFGMMEASNPIKNLPAGVRWTSARMSQLEFVIREAGQYEIALICQTFNNDVSISLTHGDRAIFVRDVPKTDHNGSCKILATASFVKGTNRIELGVTIGKHNRMARIAVLSCEALLMRAIECPAT
jgi:tetratricopeptide (TPR) repeat protein